MRNISRNISGSEDRDKNLDNRGIHTFYIDFLDADLNCNLINVTRSRNWF